MAAGFEVEVVVLAAGGGALVVEQEAMAKHAADANMATLCLDTRSPRLTTLISNPAKSCDQTSVEPFDAYSDSRDPTMAANTMPLEVAVTDWSGERFEDPNPASGSDQIDLDEVTGLGPYQQGPGEPMLGRWEPDPSSLRPS